MVSILLVSYHIVISSKSLWVYIASSAPVLDPPPLPHSPYYHLGRSPNTIRSIMGVFRTLLLSASAARAACVASTNTSSQLSDPSQTCALLKQNFSNITLLPEDQGYKDENEGAFE